MAIRNAKEEIAKQRSLHDRIAEAITNFAGSMHFVYLHAGLFAVWIIYNLASFNRGFDPFPFGLLTLIVSLEAIFLSTFVMIAQNQQAKAADVRSELDYEVNVKAEKEINDLKVQLAKLSAQLERKG